MPSSQSLPRALVSAGGLPAQTVVLKRTAQRLLSGLGFEVLQTRTLNGYLSKYAEACTELEACFRQFVFPDLPASTDRPALLVGLRGTGLSEALYLLRTLHLSLPLAGDVCEFGVAQGATSALLANEIRHTAKNLWLFDSFEGLPRPGPKDVLINDIYNLGSMQKYEGRMAEAPEQVLDRVRNAHLPLSRLKVVAGFIETTIHTQPMPDQVCFAYVDLDLYEPIKTVLRFLNERLTTGGFVLVDDYGHFSAGAQAAVDEFVMETSGKYALTLPPEFAGRFAILQRRD